MKKNILIVFLLTGMLFYSCDRQSINNNDAKKISSFTVVRKEQPDEVSGFGSLSFLSKVDITAPQEAVIKTLFFREGDYVDQGQVILLLENPQIKLAVERAKNNYSLALAARNLAHSKFLEGTFQAEAQLLALDRADAELVLAKKKWEENKRKHENQEKLFEVGGIHTEAILVSRFNLNNEWEQIKLMERELEIRKIGCRNQDLVKAGISVPENETRRREAFIQLLTASLSAELDAAHARLSAAEKELESASLALEELTVICLSSGIVGARYLEEGERVRLQDKIITIIDTTSLYAIFPVREKDAIRIQKGMTASVLIDGTGETKTGVVDLIYPQGDSQSLSFLVRVLLQDKSDIYNLKPGMFARVTVNIGPPNYMVLIPESAIFNQKDNEGSVFVINGSVLTERKIFLGFSYGDDREIKRGLNAGELIVQRPESDLREGTNVTVIN